MKNYLKEKIGDIAAGKLTNDEIEELIAFLRYSFLLDVNAIRITETPAIRGSNNKLA